MKPLGSENALPLKKVEKTRSGTLPNILSFFKNRRKTGDQKGSTTKEEVYKKIPSCLLSSCTQSTTSSDFKENEDTQPLKAFQVSKLNIRPPRGRGKVLQKNVGRCSDEYRSVRGRGVRTPGLHRPELSWENHFDFDFESPSENFNLELIDNNKQCFTQSNSPLICQDASIGTARMVYLCQK